MTQHNPYIGDDLLQAQSEFSQHQNKEFENQYESKYQQNETIIWCYNKDNKWTSYDANISKQIEQSFQQKIKENKQQQIITIPLNNQDKDTIIIDTYSSTNNNAIIIKSICKSSTNVTNVTRIPPLMPPKNDTHSTEITNHKLQYRWYYITENTELDCDDSSGDEIETKSII